MEDPMVNTRILDHMSHASTRSTCVAFILLDFAILFSYFRRKGLYGGHITYYGTKLIVHIFSSILCIITGATAILSYPNPSAAVLHGMIALVACGPSAVALAPYTAGHHGFMLSGYTCGGFAWIAAGYFLVSDWGQHMEPLFQCFVISHTFAFVRTVFFLKSVLHLPAERNKTSYDFAAFAALLATFSIAWGREGTLLWCGALILSSGSEALEVGEKWHVCGSNAKELRKKLGLKEMDRPKRFPSMLDFK